MKSLLMPSLDYLRACFVVAKDGNLVWKRRPVSHFANKGIRARWNGHYARRVAGTNERGYRTTIVDNQKFYNHRIVFFISRGFDPMDSEIDHKDGDPSNNRPKNLRIATSRQNSQNAVKPFDNKSGVKGVSWNSVELKWRAQIQGNGEKRSARFDSMTEATRWVVKQRTEMHGVFARHT